MDIVVVVLLVVVVGAAAALAGVELTRRRLAVAPVVDPEPEVPVEMVVQSAVHQAMGAVNQAVGEALGTALGHLREQNTADLQRVAVLQREQLGQAAQHARQATSAELDAKKDVIDSHLTQVHSELRAELTNLRTMVSGLAESSAQRFGEVDNALRSHAESTQVLAGQAQALKEAMANPAARGQWGERMAEDVLRLAGFQEGVNYQKQSQLEGATGRPDFTFQLPKGHELYMDVKFPMAAYLRYLEAGSEAERQVHRADFLRDVRARVRELAKRDYARESARQSVDYVLMFLPNEQLTGFIHEHDAALLDDAMGQRVVMCSPLTLFAFLGVIRQAYDNFMIEQTSDQILGLMGKFTTQWGKYADALDRLEKRFRDVEKSFDELNGTRRRQLERPLQQIDNLRRDRQIPIDGELFELAAEPGDDADVTPPNVRRLGA